MNISVEPEVTMDRLQAEVTELHDREKDLVRAIGLAKLQGLPAVQAREEISRVRLEIDATYSARRLLELSLQPAPTI